MAGKEKAFIPGGIPRQEKFMESSTYIPRLTGIRDSRRLTVIRIILIKKMAIVVLL